MEPELIMSVRHNGEVHFTFTTNWSMWKAPEEMFCGRRIRNMEKRSDRFNSITANSDWSRTLRKLLPSDLEPCLECLVIAFS